MDKFIHLFFSTPASPVLRVAGGTRACPRCPWAKAGFPIRLTCMFLECGGKPESPQKTLQTKGEHAHSSCCGDSTNHCTTVMPNICNVISL